MVIEHNLDVIKTADYIIDIGLGRRRPGGTVDCEGNTGRNSKKSDLIYRKVCRKNTSKKLFISTGIDYNKLKACYREQKGRPCRIRRGRTGSVQERGLLWQQQILELIWVLQVFWFIQKEKESS